MIKKGISPIIAVVLLVMIVVAMGISAYYFFSKTQQTIQKETQQQVEEGYKKVYTFIKIDSVTRDKIYIRNVGSTQIKKESLQLYVDNLPYNFSLNADVLEPEKFYVLELSPSLEYGEHKIKIVTGLGAEEEVKVKITATTTSTTLPITTTTSTIPEVTSTTTTTISGITTTSTTTTIPTNNPPSVSRVAFSGSTTQGSKITLFVDATDPEDPSNLLNVNLWVGRCISTDCSSSSSYEWNLNGVAMAYVSGNRFEYNWTIPYPAGTVVGATAQATDTQGAQSNWGDSFPLFTVGNATTTTTTTISTTTTSTTSTTTTTTIPWYFSNLPRRRPITINNTGSTLTNFQVSLNITYDSDMTYNFADIRFTYYNGTSETQIPYWLESYQANSWAKVWVKVPRLNSGSNTVYVYYGNSTLSSASNFDQVFTKDFEDSGLIASWHFDEGSGTIVRDVSGNGNNGTIINPSLGTYWTSSDGGQWDGRSDVKFSTGSALNFTNSFSFVEVPNSASLNPTNEISIEAWVYPQAISSSNSFKYIRPIFISSSSSLSDYQLLITMDTASLISAGKMKSDCSDLRFIDPNVAYPLNYWIETDNSIQSLVISQGDDDYNTQTKDANCGGNPSFKYYYCSHPCEPTNWYTLTFDDSSWLNGVTPFASSSSYPFSCTNVLTSAPDDLFVRKWFTVNGVPISGRLYLSYDDGIRCYINGNLVFDNLGRGGGASYWDNIVYIPGNYLVKGSNLIACWVANGGENSGGGPGALDLRLEVTVSTCGKSDTRIWVRVPSIPSGTKTIYALYGNPSATAMSNGRNTFYVFEDWESGTLDTNYWSRRGSVSPYWDVTVWNKYQGSYSSGNVRITDNQYSELYKTVTFPTRWQIDFYWSVSSESSKDFLRFWLNYEERDAISGNVGWNKKSYVDLAPGTYTLTWRYDKDASGSAGSDMGWVDYIIARAYTSSPPTVTLGEETRGLLIGKGNAYGIGADTSNAKSYINGVEISTPISSGWNFVTMTAEYISGVMQQKLYLNGILYTIQTVPGTIQVNSNPLIIFNPGILDEIKIYNRVLPENEIKAHYERRKYTPAQITYNIGNEEVR